MEEIKKVCPCCGSENCEPVTDNNGNLICYECKHCGEEFAEK